MKGTPVILTGVGRDRVGIVANVAKFLFEKGCNLLDSSMTRMRGQFAIMLMIELPSGLTITTLRQDLGELQAQTQLNIFARELTSEELAEPAADENVYMLSVYGADKPGIVAGITAKLSEQGINITDVQTKFIEPTTGSQNEGSIFVMLLEVSAPPAVTDQSLRDSLTAAASELEVDITVRQVETVEL